LENDFSDSRQIMALIKRKIRKFIAIQPVFMAHYFTKNKLMKTIAGIQNHYLFGQYNFVGSVFLNIFSVAFWFPLTIILSIKNLRHKGINTRAESGKSTLNQLVEMVFIANTCFVHPKLYYYFSLWKYEMRKQIRFYIFDGPAQNLFTIINKNVDLQILDNKIRFHEFCWINGFPTPEIKGVFESGHFHADNPVLSETSLFFKMKSGYNTRGIERWDAIGNSLYHNPTSRQVLTASHLIERYKAKSLKHTYFVQERLYNHPHFETVSSDA